MNPRRRRFARIRRACRKAHFFVSLAGLVPLTGECMRCHRSVVNRPVLSWISAAINRNLDEQGEPIREANGDGWHGVMTCGACPVQISGEVDGLPFYFRARYAEWRLSIASVGVDPVAGGDRYDVEEEYGDDEFAASWMPHAAAWALIEKHIALFRAARGAT